MSKPLPALPIKGAIAQLLPTGTQKMSGVLFSPLTNPTPKVVTLGSALRYAEFSIIPTENTAAPDGAQMWAGLDADHWGADALTETLGALVQYRSGGTLVSFTMDWIAGSYQLPPCERVDVYAVSRLTTGRKVQVSVTDGQFPGCRAPTITGAANMDAGVPLELGAPACAKAMEVWGNEASDIQVTSTGSWSPVIRRDTNTGVFFPPWSPVDFDDASRADNQFSVVSDVAQKVAVRFHLGV